MTGTLIKEELENGDECLTVIEQAISEANSIAGRLLLEAAELVDGDREDSHGDKQRNHNNIAVLWSAYKGVTITAHDVAIMMLLLKAARTKAGRHNLDDYRDMAGYAAIAGQLAER